MQKDFDRWNIIKKRIESYADEQLPFPKEGTVWMCTFGVNIGFEQDGTGEIFERPGLVVKKFNNKMYWVAPLSTKQKPYDFYYNFTDPNGMKAAVILAQLRLVSVKRFIRDMYYINDADFESIRSLLMGFLRKSKPRTVRGFSRPEGA